MYKSLVVGALVLMISTMTVAGPKEDAWEVMQQWNKAFNASDVDTLVKLHSSDALFMGTGSKTVVTKAEDIRKYFENALLTDMPRGAILGDHATMVLSDNAVLITGLSASTRTRDGKVTSSPGRVSFIIAKRPEGWRIVHFHRSAMPN
jgi:uncharacterized protein (TIGR02246 family)